MKTHTLVQKEGNEDFNVPMGCFGEAEVCEIVGTYILNQIKDTFRHHSVGFHRDDGLAIVKGLSGLGIERMKKRVIEILKDSKSPLERTRKQWISLM